MIFVLNRIGRSSIPGKTPYEFWFDKKPKLEKLTFGAETYPYIPKQKRQKLDSKAKRRLYIGYADNVKGFRIWFSSENKVKYSRDVIFNEDLTKEQQTDYIQNIQKITMKYSIPKIQYKKGKRKMKKNHQTRRIQRKKRINKEETLKLAQVSSKMSKKRIQGVTVLK